MLRGMNAEDRSLRRHSVRGPHAVDAAPAQLTADQDQRKQKRHAKRLLRDLSRQGCANYRARYAAN